MNGNARETSCQLCFYCHADPKKVLIHMLSKHKDERAFTVKCVVRNCMYRGKTWLAFKQHCKRKHYYNLNPATVIQNLNEDQSSDSEDDDVDHNPDRERNFFQQFANERLSRVAKYVLNLEAEHKISNSALDDIIMSTENLLNEQAAEMLKVILSIPGVIQYEVEIKKKIAEHAEMQSLDEIKSQHKRRTFYKRHFHLVTPERCILGSKYIKNKQGQVKLVKKIGYFVPLKKLLEKLFMLPQVCDYICNDHVSTGSIMRDVCDGSYMKNHPLTAGGQIFLQFAIYLDDLELQNPLRAQKTHKLSMFYFSLLNIPPQYRSTLNNVFLLGIARSRDIREFGLDRILSNFVSVVNNLKQRGEQFFINGQMQVVRGDLIMALGDSPASSQLAGFKESAFARRFCRMCNCTGNDMGNKLSPRELTLHTHAQYLQQCAVIHDASLTKRTRSYWSKMYGINRRSILSGIDNFPVTRNIVQDPMHCLLEGLCAQEIALILHRIVYELELLTLPALNEKLRTFQYEGIDIYNKPGHIERSHITWPRMFLKEKASVTQTLCYLLPLILGDFLTDRDPQYRNFLACMKIVLTAFSPFADNSTGEGLEMLVSSYCLNFKILHPQVSVKPKMHYALHLGRQLRQMGPLKIHNTMRYESKHSFFKNYRWKNFVNLPFSLSEKHQLWLANKMFKCTGEPNKTYVHGEVIIKQGESIRAQDLCAEVLNAIPAQFNGVNIFYKTNVVQAENVEYCKGLCLLCREDDIDGPEFSCIRYLLCCDDHILLVMEDLETEVFMAQYNAYKVKWTVNVSVVDLDKLLYKWPMPMYINCEGDMLITNRCATQVEPY